MQVRFTRVSSPIGRYSGSAPGWRFLLFLMLAGLLGDALWGVPRAHAQATEYPAGTHVHQLPADAVIDLDDICVLEPHDYDAKTRVLPRRDRVFGKAAKTATIQVEYEGFTPAAEAAFQRAVDIWETHIESPVTIRVDASFETLEENTLGSAGPTSIFVDEVDGRRSVYGNALFDAIMGTDQSTGSDIVARFNSEANWYYGSPPPEGPGPAFDEIDFTSVVLHELGHGLGFFGSMTVNDEEGEGSWDYSDLVAGQGGDPAPWVDVPAIYDRYAVEGNGERLINLYSNPSMALADALASNDVFFDGDSTNVTAQYEPGPVPPQLYLPDEWSEGSSYSHLDEVVYPAGDPNSLMTPRVARNEVIHSPGPVTCGMFADMGWPLGPDCLVFLNVEVVAFEVDAGASKTAQLTWTETDNAEVDRYVVEGRYFDEPFEPVGTIQSRGADDYDVAIARETLEQLRGGEEGLPIAGTYAFRLRLVRPGGEELFTEPMQTTIELDEPAVVSSVYPNPFAERASVSLTLQSEQDVRVEVYNALGQRVATLYDEPHPANDPRPITFEASRFRGVASGRYFFRVVGEDFSETRSAVFVR